MSKFNFHGIISRSNKNLIVLLVLIQGDVSDMTDDTRREAAADYNVLITPSKPVHVQAQTITATAVHHDETACNQLINDKQLSVVTYFTDTLGVGEDLLTDDINNDFIKALTTTAIAFKVYVDLKERYLSHQFFQQKSTTIKAPSQMSIDWLPQIHLDCHGTKPSEMLLKLMNMGTQYSIH